MPSALALVEVAVGSAVPFALVVTPASAAIPLATQSTVYAGLCGYSAAVRIRRPGAPCGCFGAGTRMSWLVVARAGLLAAASVVATVAAGPFASLPLAWRAVCLAGGAVLVATGWTAAVLRAERMV